MPLDSLRSVTVLAPSRLHFGMFSFGQPDVRQFGGVGAMIAAPGTQVSVWPSEQFGVVGVHCQRAHKFAESTIAQLRHMGLLKDDAIPPHGIVKIEHAPREHVGLGLGTQLGLSIAAAIFAAHSLPRPPAAELARIIGRGARSAIGSHGFDRGGMLVEAGKGASSAISPLLSRIELPAEWRFLLVVPRNETGLAGADEQRAFSRLPAIPLATTDLLLREAMLNLLPAALEAEFDAFSASLFRFGQLAGSCFAAEQGGAYAGPRTTAIVAHLREIGIEGVGQTSWGPTVFAACRSEQQASSRLAEVQSWLASIGQSNEYDCLVTAPCNHGAAITYP
jgi:beta-RFAP synthase